jgi:ABC-type dipeptide/oligopeptide/nickel transport system permease component
VIVTLTSVRAHSSYKDLPGAPLAFVRSLWVPCVVVGTPLAASVCRMTLAASRELLGEDFVRTAHGKGLRERRLVLFHIPGSFREISRAMDDRDIPPIQGFIVEACVLIALANAAADLLQARLDPRRRDARPVR